ncbi:MAG: hypothetical protein CVT92_14840 [Bacteroidetes bacterium HGW-Bacteroidetes-1]|jgi:hypothetical protein|nr:MAG: hypothetical protein CVT92_14840 [Bacteroidetes bacterium HGW-Bacteroidetes-1]
MKKNAVLLSYLLIASLVLNAQDKQPENWTREGKFGLNLSQNHLSNWAAGGQSSLNSLGNLNYSANYLKDNTKWDNSLNLNLGYSIIGDAKSIKTDDKIEFNSLYGLKASEKLFYSLTFSFKTQFADGFDYKVDSTNPISRFMAPGYITLGAGMDWKPNAYFTLNFSPLTGRITIVSDQTLADSGTFGVEPGENLRFELGAKAMAKLELEVAKNVTLGSKLELFSDYLKNPQNVDVDWQTLITMKVNSWLNANISAHLIYDDDIMITDKDGNKGPRTQFKEVLSIGLSYVFK